jgi:hypothetical protein
MRATLIALILPILSLPVPTASAAPEKDKDSSSYDIEVLVFENRLPELVGDELLAREAAARLRKAIETAVAPETPGVNPYLRPVVAKQLERDGHYRLLAHAHWRQVLEANPRTPVKPVRLASATAGELEGAVRFSMSRFLHLDVNMQFREPADGGATPALYQISEQRRVKSQETHYFDHPKFGVLVRILPVEK